MIFNILVPGNVVRLNQQPKQAHVEDYWLIQSCWSSGVQGSLQDVCVLVSPGLATSPHTGSVRFHLIVLLAWGKASLTVNKNKQRGKAY